MGEIAGRIRALALTWGPPGLFLVALLDSSFLPLPGVTDILLIVIVTRHRGLMPLSVAAATLGSLVGCLIMHLVGSKGGEAFVRKRFSSGKIEKAMASLRRHGVMAVLIPSLLPPPAPFKIFLLLAGAAGISRTRFATAIVIGRVARYLALGLLAVNYGARAQLYLREHGARVSLVAAGLLLAGFAVYLLVSNSAAGKEPIK